MKAAKRYATSQIRHAITQTVALLREHPEQYRFMNIDIPHAGDKACVLGHIGAFLGIPAGNTIEAVHDALGLTGGCGMSFYRMMDGCRSGLPPWDAWDWRTHASIAAILLEEMGPKHFPTVWESLVSWWKGVRA